MNEEDILEKIRSKKPKLVLLSMGDMSSKLITGREISEIEEIGEVGFGYFEDYGKVFEMKWIRKSDGSYSYIEEEIKGDEILHHEILEGYISIRDAIERIKKREEEEVN